MDHQIRRLERKNSYKKIKNNDLKVERVLKQLTFEEMIGFLQLELLKKIEEKEIEKEDIERKKELILTANEKIKCLSKENFYLRDRNFGIKKK